MCPAHSDGISGVDPVSRSPEKRIKDISSSIASLEFGTSSSERIIFTAVCQTLPSRRCLDRVPCPPLRTPLDAIQRGTSCGKSLYEAYVYSGFNWFLAMPILCVGLFDQDVRSETALACHKLYAVGRQGMDLNIRVREAMVQPSPKACQRYRCVPENLPPVLP